MNWRLILDGPAHGAWNMAMDEALLLCHSQSGSKNDHEATALPTLRFYSWQPACLSLGRFQNWDDVPLNRRTAATSDAADCQLPTANCQLPFDIVRRPTGGRAVWHQHEITYCAVLREEFLPRDARSVAGAYRWLSRGFIAGLRTLGVEAALSPADHIIPANQAIQEHTAGSHAKAQLAVLPAPRSLAGRPQPAPNCFAATTRADFVVQGRKLIGAAQMRRAGVVLQHGSLLLDGDEAAWRQAIGGSLRDVVTLRSLGVVATRDEIIAALCAGCERELGWSLQRGAPGSYELAVAQRLQTAKYSQSAWNVTAKEEDAHARRTDTVGEKV